MSSTHHYTTTISGKQALGRLSTQARQLAYAAHNLTEHEIGVIGQIHAPTALYPLI